jgi:hypothetical protein
VPAAQLVQAREERSLLARDAGQAMHRLGCEGSPRYPAAQATQAVAPGVLLYSPAAQLVHCALPSTLEKKPTVQLLHPVAPTPLAVPALHVAHAVLALAAL